MSFETVQGKFGISAKVLAYSRSSVTGDEFITYEIEYPRMILAELNTHRALSRNSASSRAIPLKKMLEQLTARPVRFGEANPGMQDKGEDFDAPVLCGHGPEETWELAKADAVRYAKMFYEAGYHKQVYNRIVEPYQMMKTVISGTEWVNFFWLRDHGAADPSIEELAKVMWKAGKLASVRVLQPGEWHLPYVYAVRDDTGVLRYGDRDEVTNTWQMYVLEDAIKISCARSAAVSFRNVDYDLKKSLEVYGRLVGDERKHASAFEHQATPMKAQTITDPDLDLDDWNVPTCPWTWENGISHMDKEGGLWSGNLQGFIQYRKLIPGENKVN